jgi:hypothetical protein
LILAPAAIFCPAAGDWLMIVSVAMGFSLDVFS